jgi:hypothetical protein
VASTSGGKFSMFGNTIGEPNKLSPAIRRIGRPAAVAKRPALSYAEVATRRVANRQMPQAYPPQRRVVHR